MSGGRGVSGLARRLLFPLGCLCLLAYFGHHIMHGDHGLQAFDRLKEDAAALERQLDQLRERRQGLERKVALMRSDSLDPDMLDERARQALNFAHPNDITILREAR